MDDWDRFRQALSGQALPAAVVDLDAFDANVDDFATALKAAGKRPRVATKSLRCPALIRRATERLGGCGLLAYSVAEAEILMQHGATDVVVAYPTVQPSDVALLRELNRRASCAVAIDGWEQAAALAGGAAPLPVVIEVDVSLRLFGLHLGVRRSPLRTGEEVVSLARRVADSPGLRLAGLLTYEAQLAGLPDSGELHVWQRAVRQAFKGVARGDVLRRRRAVVEALERARLRPAFVNGGGTGSFAFSSRDPVVDELTLGSAFLAGHLFSAFRGLSVRPALYVALQATRRPAPHMVTCHLGGYVASGEPGVDRLPKVALPRGCQLVGVEGAGEVQTPVRLPRGVAVPLGAPLLFRPAKSGELQERFNELLLVRNDAVVDRVKTYRGLGCSFG